MAGLDVSDAIDWTPDGKSIVFAGDMAPDHDIEYAGRRDMDDLMHGVDAVVKRGYIDSERLYVAGGSGGGTLTAWILRKWLSSWRRVEQAQGPAWVPEPE